MRQHRGQRSKSVHWQWRSPESPEELGNLEILLRFRDRPKGCARVASLQQHGTEDFVGFEQLNRWIPGPETQTIDLVLPLEVRHRELEYRPRSVRARRRGHPRAAPALPVKRRSDGELPSPRQLVDGFRQLLEPQRRRCRSSAHLLQLRRDLQCLTEPVAYPSTTRTTCRSPSSTKGTSAAASGSPSSSVVAIPFIAPSGFSTLIS